MGGVREGSGVGLGVEGERENDSAADDLKELLVFQRTSVFCVSASASASASVCLCVFMCMCVCACV